MVLKSESFREMKITVKWWKTVKTETQRDLCGTEACNSHYFFFSKNPSNLYSVSAETCSIKLWWFVSRRISVGCLTIPVLFSFLYLYPFFLNQDTEQTLSSVDEDRKMYLQVSRCPWFVYFVCVDPGSFHPKTLNGKSALTFYSYVLVCLLICLFFNLSIV